MPDPQTAAGNPRFQERGDQVPNKSFWLSPRALFLAALAMRVLCAILLLRAHNPQLLYEGNENCHIAANLVAGHGFSSPYANVPIAPTAQQPPLYPFLLAAIFRIFGSFTRTSLWIAIALNALAGAFTAVLIARAGRAHFSASIGVLAAWIWALWPYECLAGMPLANYALSAFFTAAWFVSAPRLLRSDTKRHWISAGLLLGLGILLNPVLAILLIAAGPWFRTRPALPSRILLASVACLLLLMPWTLRNYRAFHRFIPVRDNFGLELYLGNRPGMSGIVDFTRDYPAIDADQYSQLGETAFMQARQDEALAFIRHEPGQFLRRVAQRILAFWAVPMPWTFASLLAWYGAVLAYRDPAQHDAGAFLLLTFLIFPVVYYITHFWPTYRHAIEPLMLLAASLAISRILRRAEIRVRS